MSTPVLSGYLKLAGPISDLEIESPWLAANTLRGDDNEEGRFIGVYRHAVPHFRLLNKFPEIHIERRANSGAGIDRISRHISLCGASSSASCSGDGTGESASLAI